MNADGQKTGFLSLVSLILANLYAIIGILFLEWNASVLLYVYLIEMIIMVAFGTSKMAAARNLYDPYFARLNAHWVKRYTTKARLIAEALIFMTVFVTLISVFTIVLTFSTAKEMLMAHQSEIIILTMLMVATNAISFLFFMVRKEYERTYVSHVFRMLVARRIFPLFIGIFILAFFAERISTSLVILALLKTASDLLTYYNERRYSSEKKHL